MQWHRTLKLFLMIWHELMSNRCIILQYTYLPLKGCLEGACRPSQKCFEGLKDFKGTIYRFLFLCVAFTLVRFLLFLFLQLLLLLTVVAKIAMDGRSTFAPKWWIELLTQKRFFAFTTNAFAAVGAIFWLFQTAIGKHDYRFNAKQLQELKLKFNETKTKNFAEKPKRNFVVNKKMLYIHTYTGIYLVAIIY